MLIADILHSCSDDGIAEAAVTSIGGAFAQQIRAEATRSHVTIGALAASLVRAFATDATERDWRDLRAAMRGSDVPVLSGLAVIATTMMARRPFSAPKAKVPAQSSPLAIPVPPAPVCRLA